MPESWHGGLVTALPSEMMGDEGWSG